MTYDHWKTTNPADEFLGPEPRSPGEDFYDYIDRLCEAIETPEDQARIDGLVAAYEAENGPRHDWSIWCDAETPFAANH